MEVHCGNEEIEAKVSCIEYLLHERHNARCFGRPKDDSNIYTFFFFFFPVSVLFLDVTSQRVFLRTQYLELPFPTIIHCLSIFLVSIVTMLILPLVR